MRLIIRIAALILFTTMSARAEEFRGSLPAELAEAAKQVLAVMDDGVDWDHVADRIAESWELAAPRRLLEAGGR